MDIRKEFNELMDEIAHLVIYRRFRRNNNGKRIRCVCFSDLTREGDKDTGCPYCNGEGYLYDEEWAHAYDVLATSGQKAKDPRFFLEAGVLTKPYKTYYFKYNFNPVRNDVILEVNLDSDGVPVNPVQIVETHDIVLTDPVRGKNGRIEYWRCFVRGYGDALNSAL